MGQWPLLPSLLGLAGAIVAIILAGRSISATADELADRTGLGEAVAGALLLGAVTSLPGIITTLTGAFAGDAVFTFANPVGGIAVQTVWLAIADLLYRRSNLEHAAASLENVMQALILVGLLCFPVIAYATPYLAVFGVHPVSGFIPLFYVLGLLLLRRMHREPMWRAKQTSDTRQDVGEEPSATSLATLWWRLAGLAVIVAGTGYVIGRSGLGVIAATGLPSGFVGFTITTTVTSLPELVTLLAAVRIGALTMGVGSIIGGNVFDTLLIFLADLGYRPGPIYDAAGPVGLLLIGATMFMTVVLVSGLVMRDRHGVGFEGVLLPLTFFTTIGVLLMAPL